MIYVFDASFVGTLVIPDEKTPKTDKLQDRVGDDAVFVPQLLWYEIANIFNNLIRRKRYTYDEVLQFFPRLTAIRLETDFETGANYSQKLLRLCNDYNLSSYDASYLELAERKKASLCTMDEPLQLAAQKCGIAFLK